MAVWRLVEDSVRAGLAGVRIDDQDIEAKRGTTNSGIVVAPLETVLARYRAAVDCKRELDPNFVIMAQCYAGEAVNGSYGEALDRMRLYRDVAGVAGSSSRRRGHSRKSPRCPRPPSQRLRSPGAAAHCGRRSCATCPA
jgi:hypothetical protein